MLPLQADFLDSELAVLVPARLHSPQSLALHLEVADAHDGASVVDGPVHSRADQSSQAAMVLQRAVRLSVRVVKPEPTRHLQHALASRKHRGQVRRASVGLDPAVRLLPVHALDP